MEEEIARAAEEMRTVLMTSAHRRNYERGYVLATHICRRTVRHVCSRLNGVVLSRPPRSSPYHERELRGRVLLQGLVLLQIQVQSLDAAIQGSADPRWHTAVYRLHMDVNYLYGYSRAPLYAQLNDGGVWADRNNESSDNIQESSSDHDDSTDSV